MRVKGRSVLVACAALLAVAAALLPLGRHVCGNALSAAEILTRSAALGHGVADLRCSATVDMTFAQEPPITLSVDYLVKAPDKCKLVVTERTAQDGGHDEFEYKQGMICVLRGNRLAIWNPSNLRLIETELDQRDPIDTSFLHHGTGMIPGVGPYVQGLYCLSDARNFSPRLVEVVNIGGRRAYLLELVAKQPTRRAEPWEISKQTLWIDTEKFVPLKSEVLSPRGELVSTTTYGEIRQTGEGRWAALQTKTRVEPGSVRVASPVTVGQGAEPPTEETWKGDVPYDGRIVRRHFECVQGAVLLPVWVEVTDLEGNMLSRAVFDQYQLNTGIPDDAFALLPAKK
jgi:outer membrane lipoprotein-sorting protein